MARKTGDGSLVLREFSDPEGEFYAAQWVQHIEERKSDDSGVSWIEKREEYHQGFKFQGKVRVHENYGTDAGSARRAFYASVDQFLDARALQNELSEATV